MNIFRGHVYWNHAGRNRAIFFLGFEWNKDLAGSLYITPVYLELLFETLWYQRYAFVVPIVLEAFCSVKCKLQTKALNLNGN